jgi:hypothetical protein
MACRETTPELKNEVVSIFWPEEQVDEMED